VRAGDSDTVLGSAAVVVSRAVRREAGRGAEDERPYGYESENGIENDSGR
jgi:hypothetical protein